MKGSIITYEERYALEMKQRRERPFTTLPVYRFVWVCSVCGKERNDWLKCTYENHFKSIGWEHVIRSYPK